MKPPSDSIATQIEAILKPLIATAEEKGRLLLEEVAARMGGPVKADRPGLAPAVRCAVKHLGKAAALEAARSLEARLRREHGGQDRVK